MNSSYKMVPLKEVLTKSEESIDINPEGRYKQVTVQLWGKGVNQRNEVRGIEISSERRMVVRSKQFILSRIDARNGAFGIIPEFLDGAVVSNDFPVFNLNTSLIFPDFLGWMSKTRDFVEICKSASEGTTNRVRLKVDRFLESEIPLPLLHEQRRIVARIEELAARIDEARELRRKAVGGTNVLMSSAVESLCFDDEYPMISFGEILMDLKNGIYKPPEYWGQGLPCVRMYNIEGPRMNTDQLQLLEVTVEEIDLYACEQGDLIFNRVNSADLVGKTGLITGSYPLCTFESKNMRIRVDCKKILPEYAAIVLNSRVIRDYYLKTLKQQCGMATLNQGHVRAIPIHLPPLNEQQRITGYLKSLQSKLDAIKRHQAETAAELDALLPSILERVFRGEL